MPTPAVRDIRHCVELGEDSIAAVLTTPPSGDTRKLAIMAHGGPGGVKEGPKNLYVDLATLLAVQGIASLRFDFLGAGESTGRYRDMTITRQTNELNAVVAYARETLRPGSMALIGESYGATIAILALRDEYRCLVLLWPAIYLLDNTFASYVTPDRVHEASARGYIVEDGAEVGAGFLDEVLRIQDVSAGLRGSRVPTLFLHGDSDREVPYHQSLRAAQLVAGPQRVVVVPGGDHCLEAPAERVVVNREVLQWLDAYL